MNLDGSQARVRAGGQTQESNDEIISGFAARFWNDAHVPPPRHRGSSCILDLVYPELSLPSFE
jgi:hypothetical protein